MTEMPLLDLSLTAKHRAIAPDAGHTIAGPEVRDVDEGAVQAPSKAIPHEIVLCSSLRHAGDSSTTRRAMSVAVLPRPASPTMGGRLRASPREEPRDREPP